MNFLVLDCETGGLAPGHHSLLEVGLLAYKDNKVIDGLQMYIRQEEYIVTPKALEVNGLKLDEVYSQGFVRSRAVELIIEFVQRNFKDKDEYSLLGHNVSLDKYMIRHLFAHCKVDMDDFISYRMFDTSTMILLCKELSLLPATLSGGLHKVAAHLGLSIDYAHTAIGDAKTTIEVYEKLLELMKGVHHGRS